MPVENPFDHNVECRYCDEQAMHRGDCPWLVALVAEVEQLQLDQRMLATTVRNTVLALGDVGDDWTGTVADGIALINTNVDRVNAEIERLHETLDQTVMVHMREMRAAREQVDRLEAELAAMALTHAREKAAQPEPFVDGYDATFWHSSYQLLRDAVTTHLDAFIHDDDVAEEAILIDAIAKAATQLAQVDRLEAELVTAHLKIQALRALAEAAEDRR